jgi:N-acyl-D-amino-acid deacylase
MRPAIFLFIISFSFVTACSQPNPTSTFITNAVIMDGSGESAIEGSVRIDGDRIVAVGDLAPLHNENIVDAGGMVLTPGFIDTHSHHDDNMSEYRDMPGLVTQGITTIVRGADGNAGIKEFYGTISQADFNRRFEASPVAVNIASFSPHNSIRAVVMGADFKRHSTDGELAEMAKLVEDDMKHGALGLGTGLEYMPGIYSSTEEVIELSRVVSSYGGHYMSHVRDEDNRFLDAVDEVIRIGREARIPVHVSHIKLADKALWGTTEDVVDRMNAARAEGVQISADIYPYVYWQSNLAVLFPERDYTDRDVATYTFEHTTAPETLIIARFEPNPSYNGLSIAEIARLNEQDVESTLLDLTQQADRYLQETGTDGASILALGMDEADVAALMSWEHTNICTDGDHGGTHPRGYGSFPRFLVATPRPNQASRRNRPLQR